jgi:hypothetical protein
MPNASSAVIVIPRIIGNFALTPGDQNAGFTPLKLTVVTGTLATTQAETFVGRSWYSRQRQADSSELAKRNSTTVFCLRGGTPGGLKQIARSIDGLM